MLEGNISEEQQVHVMTMRPDVALVMGMGDQRGVKEQVNAEEIKELSLSGHAAHFQTLVLWATHIYPWLSPSYSTSMVFKLRYLLSNHEAKFSYIQ